MTGGQRWGRGSFPVPVAVAESVKESGAGAVPVARARVVSRGRARGGPSCRGAGGARLAGLFRLSAEGGRFCSQRDTPSSGRAEGGGGAMVAMGVGSDAGPRPLLQRCAGADGRRAADDQAGASPTGRARLRPALPERLRLLPWPVHLRLQPALPRGGAMHVQRGVHPEARGRWDQAPAPAPSRGGEGLRRRWHPERQRKRAAPVSLGGAAGSTAPFPARLPAPPGMGRAPTDRADHRRPGSGFPCRAVGAAPRSGR